jgi:hypothetical protein
MGNSREVRRSTANSAPPVPITYSGDSSNVLTECTSCGSGTQVPSRPTLPQTSDVPGAAMIISSHCSEISCDAVGVVLAHVIFTFSAFLRLSKPRASMLTSISCSIQSRLHDRGRPGTKAYHKRMHTRTRLARCSFLSALCLTAARRSTSRSKRLEGGSSYIDDLACKLQLVAMSLVRRVRPRPHPSLRGSFLCHWARGRVHPLDTSLHGSPKSSAAVSRAYYDSVQN